MEKEKRDIALDIVLWLNMAVVIGLTIIWAVQLILFIFALVGIYFFN